MRMRWRNNKRISRNAKCGKVTRAEFSVRNVRTIQLMHENSEADICWQSSAADGRLESVNEERHFAVGCASSFILKMLSAPIWAKEAAPPPLYCHRCAGDLIFYYFFHVKRMCDTHVLSLDTFLRSPTRWESPHHPPRKMLPTRFL